MKQKELIGELFWFLIDEFEKRQQRDEFNEVIFDLSKSIKALDFFLKEEYN